MKLYICISNVLRFVQLVLFYSLLRRNFSSLNFNISYFLLYRYIFFSFILVHFSCITQLLLLVFSYHLILYYNIIIPNINHFYCMDYLMDFFSLILVCKGISFQKCPLLSLSYISFLSMILNFSSSLEFEIQVIFVNSSYVLENNVHYLVQGFMLI